MCLGRPWGMPHAVPVRCWVKMLQTATPTESFNGDLACQNGCVAMGDGLDRNHRIYSRGAGERGAIHHKQITSLPGLTLGVGGGCSGRVAHAGAAHDVERKKRQARCIPSGGIHGLDKGVERAANSRLVGAPLRVRRKNQASACRFEDTRRSNKAAAKVSAVELRERVMGNRISLAIDGHTSAVAIPA